jgi:hypothetical protein
MSDVIAVDGQASGSGLSQTERVVDTFIAPSKTFTDILRDSSWWLPYLIGAIIGCVFAFAVLNKIGLPALVESTIHQSKGLEDQVTQATPEVAAQIRARIGTNFKFFLYASPLLGIIVGVICAAVLLGTANFVFGGKAKFKQMLAVWFYGVLPLTLFYLLVIVSVYAGLAGDSFNINNALGTNIGYYMAGGDSPRWLVALLSAVDIFAIWAAVLLTIGVSIVAGIRRSSAAIVVFGWWFLVAMLKVVGAAIGG